MDIKLLNLKHLIIKPYSPDSADLLTYNDPILMIFPEEEEESLATECAASFQ